MASDGGSYNAIGHANFAAEPLSQKKLQRGRHGRLSNSVTPALTYKELFLMWISCYLSTASLFAGTTFWPRGGEIVRL